MQIDLSTQSLFFQDVRVGQIYRGWNSRRYEVTRVSITEPPSVAYTIMVVGMHAIDNNDSWGDMDWYFYGHEEEVGRFILEDTSVDTAGTRVTDEEVCQVKGTRVW